MVNKKGNKHLEKSKKKMRENHNYSFHKSHSKKTKDKISESLTNRKLSESHRNNLRGEKNHRWKGGIMPLNHRIRALREFSEWRFNVFKRDNFTCQNCKEKLKKLNAHHIKLFSYLLKEYNIQTIEQAINCAELWFVSNGITYCEECHKEIHKNIEEEMA